MYLNLVTFFITLASFELVFCQESLESSYLEDEYYQLTTRQYYVDKTELLAALFEENIYKRNSTTSTRSKVRFYHHVTTAPRGFGKTTILRMVKAFSQIEFNADGSPKTKNQTKAYKIFRTTQIGNYPAAVENCMAEFYVFLLDLHFEKEYLTDEQTALAELSKRIQRVFKEHEYVVPHIRDENDAKHMEIGLKGAMDREQIQNSLLDLTFLLRRAMGKRKVVLLVDNFDSLTWYNIMEPKYYIKSLDELLKYMLHELTCRKMRLTTSIFAGITNFNFYSVDEMRLHSYKYEAFLNNGRLGRFFGFEVSEVNALLDKYKCSQEEKSEVEAYYGAYESVHCQVQLYNPLSIVGYLTSKEKGDPKVAPYWAQNQSVELIVQFCQTPLFRQKVTDLLNTSKMRYGGYIKYHLPGIYSKFLESSDRNYGNLHEDDVEDLFIFLHETGFLCVTREKATYQVPNQEVAELLRNKVKPALN